MNPCHFWVRNFTIFETCNFRNAHNHLHRMTQKQDKRLILPWVHITNRVTCKHIHSNSRHDFAVHSSTFQMKVLKIAWKCWNFRDLELGNLNNTANLLWFTTKLLRAINSSLRMSCMKLVVCLIDALKMRPFQILDWKIT